jgi:hypothetical protein
VISSDGIEAYAVDSDDIGNSYDAGVTVGTQKEYERLSIKATRVYPYVKENPTFHP